LTAIHEPFALHWLLWGEFGKGEVKHPYFVTGLEVSGHSTNYEYLLVANRSRGQFGKWHWDLEVETDPSIGDGIVLFDRVENFII